MNAPSSVCILTDECVWAIVLDTRRSQTTVRARGRCTFERSDSLLREFDAEQTAEAIHRAIVETGVETGTVTLVLPLHWSFVHALALPSMRWREQTVLYEFEEFLPLPLEDVTTGLWHNGNGHVVAAALPTAPVQQLLEALSHLGINVQHVTIDALAAQCASNDSNAGDIVLLDSRWARIAWNENNASAQATSACGIGGCDDSMDRLSDLLQSHDSRDEHQDRVRHFWKLSDSVNPRALTALQPMDATNSEFLAIEDALDEIAKRALASAPSFDLRTGQLAGSHRQNIALRLAQHCLILATVLVIAFGIDLYAKRRSLESEFESVRQVQMDAYSSVFVVEDLPPGAAMRLASQRKRLEGLTHIRDSAVKGTATTQDNAIESLRNVVAKLPADLRIMLLDVRLDERQFTLRGHTVQHRDAERIVEAINTVSGLAARPPRTTRLNQGGVEFSIIATKGATNDRRP